MNPFIKYYSPKGTGQGQSGSTKADSVKGKKSAGSHGGNRSNSRKGGNDHNNEGRMNNDQG